MNSRPLVLRLKRLNQVVRRVIRQIRRLPRTIAVVLKNRRRGIAEHAAEVERLDRIRNPSDYLGK